MCEARPTVRDVQDLQDGDVRDMANEIQKTNVQTLATYMNARTASIKSVLPKHLTAERVVKIALAAATRTKELAQCTPQSFALAVIQASQLGLEAGSPLGEAYLVPFTNRGVKECTLIIGYRGLITLARRSGEIESIEAHAVHAKDEFDFAFGLDAKLHHKPFMPPPPADGANIAEWTKTADPGPMIAVYAIVRIKGGAVQTEVMTRADVERIRAMSRQAAGTTWTNHHDEMSKKTVIRRIAKYLPMSIELANALAHDEQTDHGAPDALAYVDAGIDYTPPEGNDELEGNGKSALGLPTGSTPS